MPFIHQGKATMATCQARILGEEYTIQGTDVKCHHTRECSAPSVKKITVDDGDACFHICAACFRRFLTKSSKKDTWLGWFDCEYPPHAQVTHSAWYHAEVKKAWDAYNKNLQDSSASSVSEEEEISVDILTQQIKELELWIKGEGRLDTKGQVKKRTEIIRLRAEIIRRKR